MDKSCLEHRITNDERRFFDAHGYLIVPDALAPGLTAKLAEVLERLVAWRRRPGVRRAGAEHLLWRLPQRLVPPRMQVFHDGAALVLAKPIWAHEILMGLVDQQTTLPKVWGLLGWNIHLYSQAAVVTPPSADDAAQSAGTTAARQSGPTALGWHRDGGRVTSEAEGSPPPRLAVRVAYFVSDVSERGRGNLCVVPGSHRWSGGVLEESERVAREAEPVCVPAGTAVIFDRRLVHSASRNISTVTRKALFYGYAHRWVHSMYDPGLVRRTRGSDAIRLQLLGRGSAYGRFFPGEDDVPLRRWLQEHDPQALR